MGLSPGRVKPKTIKLVFVASPLNSQYSGERANTGWFGIRIMCPYGVTYQSADCCFSELALSNYKNPNRRVGFESKVLKFQVNPRIEGVKVPSESSNRRMILESNLLASLQVGEKMLSHELNTLHVDGTTDAQKHFLEFHKW